MEIKLQCPDKGDFFGLYKTTGWEARIQLGEDKLIQAIENSWFVVSVYEAEKLIGFGRIVSDGVFQAFICDLIVLPKFREQGIGTAIFNVLLRQCKEHNILSVKLFSAEGKSSFYKKRGFEERKDSAPGMWWKYREMKSTE